MRRTGSPTTRLGRLFRGRYFASNRPKNCLTNPIDSTLVEMQGAKKIVKKDGAPSELEVKVANELVNLEANQQVGATVKTLVFSAAKEIELDGGKKAVLIFVPVPVVAEFRKVQKTVVEELEKKFGGGAQVLVIANRTMVSPGTWQRSKKFSGVRPRSRTLKAVQEALLDDLVFPTEITGKRTRVRTDGSRLLKVLLAQKDAVAVEGKLDTFRTVYKKLTSKDVSFELRA